MLRICSQVKSKLSKGTQQQNNKNSVDVFFRKFLIEWFLLSIIIACLTIAYAETGWHRYGYVLYDNLSKLITTSEKQADNIIIIAIDNKSLNTLGRWPWPREYHADLIRTLQHTAPKVLAFNIFFTEDEESADSGLVFKDSIEHSNFPVILPILEGSHYSDFFFKTYNTLLSTVNIVPDPDGVIRRVKLIDNSSNIFLPQMSLQAYWGAGYKSIEPAQIYHEQLIDYEYIDNSGFRVISYSDVLKGNYTNGDFSGKIVLVGVTAKALGESFVTPITTSHSAVGIHAQIISNILSKSFIVDLDKITSAYISAAVILFYLLVVFLITKIHISYVALTFSFCVLLASAVLLYLGVWWSPISSITVFFFSWIIWNWRRSIAIINWLRYSLIYGQDYESSALPNSVISFKKPIIQDRLQFELNNLERLLVSAKKVKEKRTKLRNYLSHDLRTPQISMIDLINLQRNPETAMPEHSFHLYMERLINNSLSLLDDLLLISKSDADELTLKPVLLAAIIQDVLDYLWPRLNSNKINVIFDTETNELGEILGDAKLLLRAFSNILENTIKYAGEKSIIIIKISRSDEHVILSISDDGPGLYSTETKQQLNHLKGSSVICASYGLGLELVDSVVASHNATLTSHSKEGLGVEFVFVFPILVLDDD